MFKRQKYIYECNEFRILNPDKGLREEIRGQMGIYLNDDGDLDLEDANFKLFLLQTLVESDDENYQFLGMTTEDIEEIEKDPSFEYETILYFIGNIMSDMLISEYRANIMELRQSQIQLLQNESLKVLEELAEDVNMLTKKEQRAKAEREVIEKREVMNLDEVKKRAEQDVENLDKYLEQEELLKEE